VVLQGFDLRLHRQVALKVFRKELEEGENRLLTEARAAAAINHPNVCPIYNVETIDGIPTIVMEYLRGLSLASRLTGPIPEPHFVTIAHRIASGLAAAHSQGLVHRDLKPGNIVFRSDLDPVIVDFGLAAIRSATQKRSALASNTSNNTPRGLLDFGQATSSAQDSIAATSNSLSSLLSGNSEASASISAPIRANPAASKSSDDTVTHVGLKPFLSAAASQDANASISGTPAYMSPEQAAGGSPQIASDVFSLGLIFVEMLTGQRAITFDHPLSAIQNLADASYVESLPQSVPDPYRTLLSKMLTHSPSERASIHQVLDHIESLA
jgi:eukaryotic-like serine/threonine-protein kinase